MDRKILDILAGTFTAGASIFAGIVVLWAYFHGNVARIHINIFGEGSIEALVVVPIVLVSSMYTYYRLVWNGVRTMER